MDNSFIDILKKLIAEQGKEAMLNPAKCKAFLADYTKGEYKKESRLLLQALEAGVSKEIDNTDELNICKQQQIRVLQEEYFLKNETAADVVDTLSLVLKGDKTKVEMLKTETQSVSLSNSSPSLKTASIKTENNLSNIIPIDDGVKVETTNKEKSGYNKTVITVVLIIVGSLIAYFAYQEYKQYQAEKEVEQAIDAILDLFK